MATNVPKATRKKNLTHKNRVRNGGKRRIFYSIYLFVCYIIHWIIPLIILIQATYILKYFEDSAFKYLMILIIIFLTIFWATKHWENFFKQDWGKNEKAK